MATSSLSVPSTLKPLADLGISFDTYKHFPQPAEGSRRVPLKVMAAHTDEGVLVYQAFKPSIANYVLEHKKFDGAPEYGSRMTWIKPQLAWMLFRSDWCRSRNQEKVVGLWLKRSFFEDVVTSAEGTKPGAKKSPLRVQWDPERHILAPYAKLGNRVIQLGLNGVWRERLASGEEILDVVDMTPYVEAHRDSVLDPSTLVVPAETEMSGLLTVEGDMFEKRQQPKPDATETVVEAETEGSGSAGAGAGAGAGEATTTTTTTTTATES